MTTIDTQSQLDVHEADAQLTDEALASMDMSQSLEASRQATPRLDAMTMQLHSEILINDLKAKNWEKVMKGGTLPDAKDMFNDLPKWVNVIGWNKKPDLTKTGLQNCSIDVAINGTTETILLTMNVVENAADIAKVKPVVKVGKGWELDPKDFFENPDDLWADYEIKWNQADPTFDKSQTVKIKIVKKWSGELIKSYNCPVNVIENSTNLRAKNWEKVLKDGTLPNAEDMFNDLPNWVEVNWNKKPDLTKTGVQNCSIDVEINGTTETIPFTINIVENVTDIAKVKPSVKVGKGWTLDPKDFFENPNDLWADYEIEWNQAEPTFDKTQQVKVKIVKKSDKSLVKSYNCQAEVIWF